MIWPTWIDPWGIVHIRRVGTGKTMCDREVGPYTETHSKFGCDTCVHRDAVESQMKIDYP